MDHSASAIIVASYRRSGTHLTIDLLRRQFSECRSWKLPGERLNRLYLSLDGLVNFAPRRAIPMAVGERIVRRQKCPIIKTHLTPPLLRDHFSLPSIIADMIQRAAPLYVIRDGRSALCSLQTYMSGFNEEAQTSISAFIRQQDDQGRSRVRQWRDHVEAWLDISGVLPVYFERLLSDPKTALSTIASHVGLEPHYREPLLPDAFHTLWRSRLARAVQWSPEATNILGRTDGRKPVRWPQAFTRDDRAFFHQEAGDLLIRLGYEADSGWIDNR